MRKQIRTRIQTSKATVPHVALTCARMVAAPSLTGGHSATNKHQAHARHRSAAPARLLKPVHNATRQFTDVDAASAAHGRPYLGCVSVPDHGAVGVHYAHGGLEVEPEVEQLQLVGVAFIVDAATGMARHNSPNQFGLPALSEPHVWDWRNSPNGAFADWNIRVTSEGR